MDRVALRQRVEVALQDTENKRWSDSEINQYIDDAQSEFVRISRYPQVEATVDLISSTSGYGIISTTSTATVDNNTIVVTTKDGSGNPIAHNLTSGAAVRFKSGTSNINLTYIISVLTTSTFRVFFENPDASSYTNVEVIELGPNYSRPSSMTELLSVSFDDRELRVMTEEDMNKAATNIIRTGSVMNLLRPYSLVPSTRSYTDIPRWREENGSPIAAVVKHKSSGTFRLFPLPYDDEDLFTDKGATTKYSRQILVKGVKAISALSTEASTPDIDSQYHEGLVWGALERAYLKESQLRNVEKSGVYRQKFLSVVGDAANTESLNSGSISGGVNDLTMTVQR